MKHGVLLGPHRPPARLTARHRRLVYVISVLVWGSGVLWLLFHNFLKVPGEFGDSAHPLEFWWRALHGLSAFAFVWLTGLLWGVHISRAWPLRQRRWTGSSLFALCALMVVSGYLLYYAGGEVVREWTALLHWTIGLGSPLLLIVHVLSKVHSKRGIGSRSRDLQEESPRSANPVESPQSK